MHVFYHVPPGRCFWCAPLGGVTSKGGVARKKFIAIAGNIGAGKTELTSFLCRKYGLTPSFEPNDQNPYLADFYKDMKTWAFRSQLFFLTHKFRLHLALQDEPGAVIQDRTICSACLLISPPARKRCARGP